MQGLKGNALKAFKRLQKLSGTLFDGGATPLFTQELMSEQNKPEEKENKKESPIDKAEVLIKRACRPIVDPEVDQMIQDAISQYMNRNKWKAWGLHKLREQGTAILLKGPHGTGKTTIARWMARQMNKKMVSLEIATIAGGEPGDSERNVISLFEKARELDNALVFMDECNSILGDRSEVSADGRTWQSSTTEQVMLQMNIYPGPVVCATNLPKAVDPALDDRFLFVIQVDRPKLAQRILLWKQKWPQTFPLRLKEKDYKRLAEHDLTGRQIENVIVAIASRCIRLRKRPNLTMFDNACETETKKHIYNSDDNGG